MARAAIGGFFGTATIRNVASSMAHAVLACLVMATPAVAVEFFVAPQGNDAGPGNEAAPFATLIRAREAVRGWKKTGSPSEPVTVFLRGGTHGLPEGLHLERQDSGTAEAPVTFRAFQQERPVLLGGREVLEFSVHRGEILKANLAAEGFHQANFRQLYFRGQRQQLARFPNFDPQDPIGGGWAYVAGDPVSMYTEIPGEDKRTLAYRPQDERAWAKPEEMEVFVFPRYNWWNNECRIQSLDRAKRRITLADEASYAIRPGDRYYVSNALEELDAPGEWYLDKAAQVLYFWPPAPLQRGDVTVPTTRTLLTVGSETAHVVFQGLTFTCAAGDAIVLDRTSQVQVVGCTVRETGDYHGSGVVIRGGSYNGVVGCDIFEVGRNAISIEGGDRLTLKAADNYAENNYLHHTGVCYKQGVGISLTGVGNRASHNLIHDCPRFGILFSGNNLLIEFNHIRHVNLETADTGAVYTGGRDWLGSRGTVIRHNFFHDILGYGLENGCWVTPHYSWGIYLDDNAGGVDVLGNIVARAKRGLIHLHNGRDNRVENNVFVDGERQQIECNGWTLQHPYWKNHLPTMIAGYEQVAGQPAWRHMRNMALHPRNAVLADSTIMSGNSFERNIIYYRRPEAKYAQVRNFSFAHNRFAQNLIWCEGGPIDIAAPQLQGPNRWAAWQAQGMDGGSVIASPKFVDPAHDDYRLQPDSPAFQLGFQAIPIEKIGPYADPRRATWPLVEAPGAREFTRAAR